MTTTINFSNLIHSLKEKEIKHHRMKIVHLSQQIIEHPEEPELSMCLKASLERLETLLIA